MKKDDLCYQDTDHLFSFGAGSTCWTWKLKTFLFLSVWYMTTFLLVFFAWLMDMSIQTMRVDTKSITIKKKKFIFRGGLHGVLKWPGSVAVLSISFKTYCKKSETRITATASILKQYIQTHEKVECLFNITPQNVLILGVQNTVFIVYEYNCIKLKDTSKITHSIIH